MAQSQTQNIAAINMAARNAILSRALEMEQLIFSQTIATPGVGNNVITVPPRNVGLIKGFWVELSGTMTEDAEGGHDIKPTELNVANFLSNITFYDLNNNLRINTPGWHMHLLNSAKKRRPFCSAFTTDNPCGFGSNLGANAWIRNPGTLNGAAGTVRMLYWVPLAYSDRDLRGAIYANVVNATLQLTLTINPAPFATDITDNTFAMYTDDSGGDAGGHGTLSNVTVNVYQCYYDQLPQVQGKGPFLPILDLSTIYELKTTALTGLSQNQDFPIPYSNFREFISTIFMFDNGAPPLNAGTDINYIALQSANFTNMFKVDPYLLSMQTREEVQDDFPIGTYYISHRKRPLSTVQYGNMELIVNPSTVNSGAQILTAYEDFAMVNSVTGAGSLPAG